jgi:hypothetical protein
MKVTLDFKDGKGDLRVENFSVDDFTQSGPLKERLQAVALQFFEAMLSTVPMPPTESETPEKDPDPDPVKED